MPGMPGMPGMFTRSTSLFLRIASAVLFRMLYFYTVQLFICRAPERGWRAGLIDDGETPQIAALRELKEETGYTGTIVNSTGRQYMSPGLTGENVVTVFVEVTDDTLAVYVS